LVGELLTMYQLERHGVQVAHVDRDGQDLWVRTPSGRMLTVQVKAATEATTYARDRTPWYHFHIGNAAIDTDLYALVALQPEVVLICRPDEMRMRWAAELFTKERMISSIRELLA
jgi:hypothetical protein